MTGGASIGIVGLGVMGRNLALNIVDRGFAVAAYDADPAQRARAAGDGGYAVAGDLAAMVAALAAPRAILLMVPAGAPVDAALDGLRPLVGRGDVMVDGGNSNFADTIRRARAAASHGIGYVGLGVSGGDDGARHGPALMAGGDVPAWQRVGPIFSAIAARAAGVPCCDLVGADGAGHFVKMAHNGIEYAQMQLIAEAYLVLRHRLGMDLRAIADAVVGWNRGDGAAYLLQITADILRTVDPDGGDPLLDRVADRTGHKGTGVWTVETALALGVPVPTIAAAVWARAISASRDAARTSPSFPAAGAASASTDDVGRALRAASMVAYAEGFDLIAAGAARHGWTTDRARVAELWREGCIVRAAALDRIAAAFRGEPGGHGLLDRAAIAGPLAEALPAWRRLLVDAAGAGLPVPAFAAALAHLSARTAPEVGARLVAAQRDCFGAHGFHRIDRDGSHHASWTGE
ncbi:MAG: NADP-dependent phosphogluconate dehydrogenase [Alphaproteobacteria bacterium]